jgi:hypothetical protein
MAGFDQGLRFDSGARFDEPVPPPPAAIRRTRMAKVKLDLDLKKPQEVLNASSAHIAAMATPEGLALFPTPEPTAVDYLIPHNALAAGVNLVTSLEGQLTAARNALPGLLADLKATMEERATYVEQTTGGDASKIPISGFAVAGTAQPIGPLPRPENVKAAMTPTPGVIRVSCEPIKGTQTYIIEFREHLDGQPWVQVKLSTKSRNDIPGLISGKNYAFRIAAVGAAGQSPWSDEAVCMAP